MENLTLKLTRTELQEITLVVSTIFKSTKDQTDPKKYFHFYNVRALVKKLMQKNLSLVGTMRKALTIKININEHESLLYYIDFAERITLDPYYLSLMYRTLSTLEKQRCMLYSPSNFVLPE